MITIKENLCPSSKYSYKCPYTRTPTRIVIHNTANDAPATNEVSYMLNRSDMVSFHYAVDDKEAVQGLPLSRSAFASGDGGKGTGNLYGIHIEICYSLSGGAKFTKAEENAAELVAQLLKQYGWGIDKVTKHQDYDGKYCPHRTLDLGWKRFLNMVQNKLNELEDDDMKEADVLKIIDQYFADQAKKSASSWANNAIDYCKKQGIMSGDADGNFRPQSSVTRQELAQVMFNIPAATLFEEYLKTKKDNDASAWSEDARMWAIQTGLISGGSELPNGEPNYMWEDIPTREQLVQILYNFNKYLEDKLA